MNEEERRKRICAVHRRYLLPNLDNYRRPGQPVMPQAFINMNEDTILERVRKAKRTDTPKDSDRDMLELFGLWRNSVLRYESSCESNILLLFRAAASFSAINDDVAAMDLLAFLKAEYGVDIDDPSISEFKYRRIAYRYSRCPGAMSDKLLNDERRKYMAADQPNVQQIDLDLAVVFCDESEEGDV